MKVYLRTSGDVIAQAKVYAAVFNGVIRKMSYRHAVPTDNTALQPTVANHEYAYIEVETGDRFMLAPYSDKMPRRGYQLDTVFTYTDEAKYNAAAARLYASAHFKNDYPITRYDFNTLIKFYDEWGYGWILELNLPKPK